MMNFSIDEMYAFAFTEDNKVAITGCNKNAAGEIIIPETIEGYPVTSISEFAFADCTKITNIYIPKTVTDISSNAFRLCSCITGFIVDDDNPAYQSDNCGVLFTKNSTYPDFDGVELVQYPAGSPITKYTVPDGVAGVGLGGFGECANLKEIIVSQSVTYIDRKAFAYCTNLQTLSLVNTVCIGDFAFVYCENLQSIAIPDTLASIGYGIFGGCAGLLEIYVSEYNKFFSSDSIGALFNKDKTILYQYPGGAAKTGYVVPHGTKKIDDGAFAYATALQRITLSESVIEIGDGAFAGCSALRYVHIPSSVTTIGKGIFNGDEEFPCTAYICSDTKNCYAKTYAEGNGYTFKFCSGHSTEEESISGLTRSATQ